MSLLPRADGWIATVGDTTVVLRVDDADVTVDGLRSRRTFAVDDDARCAWLADAGWSARLRRPTRRDLLDAALSRIDRMEGSADPLVRSPMPGTVVSVAVRDGDQVRAGDVLAAVEAMKMEHQLIAGLAGVVRLSLKPGDLVKAQQIVATIEVDPGSTSAPTKGDAA